ncbi:ester cyclase, partial [Burkholderia pseudomallei]
MNAAAVRTRRTTFRAIAVRHRAPRNAHKEIPMPALFRRRPLAAIRAAAALSLAATLAPAHADTTGLIEP